MRSLSSIPRPGSVLVLMAFVVRSASAQSGLVTLQGRNFKVDGQDFFPTLVNYGIEYTTTLNSGSADTSQIFVSPEAAYDRNVDSQFECHNPAQCDAQLLAHLQKVRAMGFNALRLVGLNAMNVRDTVTAARHYLMTVHCNAPWAPAYRLFMDYPDLSGPIATKHFQLARHVLDLCDSADLKVLILTGGRVGYEPQHPNRPWQYYNSDDAVAYATYLARLTDELEGHPAVLGFDLWNEPSYGGDGANHVSKQTVCDWTSRWYDTIKVHDPRRLVTLGGSHITDLNSWDPMVMKLDFYAPHFYPSVELFGNYDVDKANDEMRAEMYWLGKTCPMPWILGETGFSADDDTTDYLNNPIWECLYPEPLYHKMPWMWGNEDQQVAYAFQSMDALRASQGSGYGWWDFQSIRSNPYIYPDTVPIVREAWQMSSSWLSVLGYGHDTIPWRIKKLADTLDSYVLPPEEHELPPAPYNYPSWLAFPSSDTTQTWGWIQDQYYSPIADAVIEWEWNYNNDGFASTLTNPRESAWDRVTTFSDGYFQVPRPPHHPPGWRRDSTMQGHLAFHGGLGFGNLQNEDPGALFTLPRYGPRVVDTTEIEWPDFGETVVYRAYNDLIVTDQIITGNGDSGAVADYSARFNVHVIGDFHAMPGSETHLFTARVWPDCNAEEYRTVVALVTSKHPKANELKDERPSSLTLKFEREYMQLAVAPNPAGSHILITGLESNVELVIFDEQGRKCYNGRPISQELTIDLTSFVPGQYVVQQVVPAGIRTAQFQMIR